MQVNINFIDHEGTRRDVEVETGGSVMQAAVMNDIPGIVADCGGCCSCATCHVYVAEEWLDKVGGTNPTEKALLGMRDDRRPNSRLSCQIRITKELDGLVVSTPEFQY